jgi:hypothetical protein
MKLLYRSFGVVVDFNHHPRSTERGGRIISRLGPAPSYGQWYVLHSQLIACSGLCCLMIFSNE